MSRTIALVVVAALASVGAVRPVAAEGTQAAGVSASLTIVDASTDDFPGNPNPVTVCVDGAAVSSDLSAGEQIGPLTITAPDVTVDVFDAPQADCATTPSLTAELTLAVGDDIGLVLTLPEWFTFRYQLQCPPDGTAWVMAAQAADITENVPSVDVYLAPADSTNDSDVFPIIDDLTYLTSQQSELPTGSYDFLFFEDGANPATDTPLGEVEDVALDAETSTQLFLAGGSGAYEGRSGAFATQRPTVPCATEPPSTTPTTSTSTTRPAATGSAPPAVPIRSTATFTG